MRLVSVAPRSAPWIAPSIRRRAFGSSRDDLAQQFEIAEHRHQQIVEIVRHAAGQLAEALDLLHLVHLCERGLALAGPLLDAAFQIGVGLRQFGSTLLDPPLQLGVERLELPGLAVEFGKYANFGAQQVGDYRHRHVIDRSRRIAAQQVEVGHLDRRDEDDRGLLKARVLADHRRQLEAVEVGHADVDEHDRDVVLEQLL